MRSHTVLPDGGFIGRYHVYRDERRFILLQIQHVGLE